MFNFDEAKVPQVEFEKQWELSNGEINQIYRVGNWSFEAPGDLDMESAETAIYAWIAWKNFIEANGEK